MKSLFFLSAALLAGCAAPRYAKGTPECIRSKIEAFSPEACELGANVKSYMFQSEKVYVFNRGKCGADFTSEVVNESCKHLGYLGGFAGNMKINGENFENAILIETVWEKPESAPTAKPEIPTE